MHPSEHGAKEYREKDDCGNKKNMAWKANLFWCPFSLAHCLSSKGPTCWWFLNRGEGQFAVHA